MAFKDNIFINCPFDAAYEPILQAILFCLIYLGFEPRIASERRDSSEYRLEKIVGLIISAKYSIHDLSHAQARDAGEFYRLNMPFELGIDYGCRQFMGGKFQDKRFLILEEERHRYKAALSDLAGCDIAVHRGRFDEAIRQVRNWLATETDAPSPTRIINAYDDFQKWREVTLREQGFSDEDIRDYPTPELLRSMKQWMAEGKPI